MPDLVSASCVEAVRTAAGRWQEQLIDTTGRNRLRNYRDLRTGTLDLMPGGDSSVDALTLDRLLARRTVDLSALFPKDGEDTDAFDNARRRLAAIHRKARENLEEKGIDTLFAAIGLATWKVDAGMAPHAPVVLLPLDVEATGAAARDFGIAVSGDAHLNPVLTHILRAEHDVDTDAAEEEVAEAPPDSFAGFRSLLDRLAESWEALPDLEITPRVVAAVFSYATMPLVADLADNCEQFAGNALVAAMAGDTDALATLADRICDPAPHQPDLESPRNEFLVLDADSSQHIAINRVLGGESLVIQGPPGTGKSQTIANCIAALIARRRRVLFVAEKRAAIEAVTKRLDTVDLDSLVMDMHGGVTSRRDFARTLTDSLDALATIPPRDYSQMHGGLHRHRDALLAHADTVHKRREPSGLSLYEIEERLLSVPPDARTQLRLSTGTSGGLTSEGFGQLAEEIREWTGLDGHAFDANHPEWSRSTIANADEARKAFHLTRDLARTHLPDARDAVFAALDEIGLQRPDPDTVVEWQRTLDFASNVEQTLARCHPGIYRIDHAALGAALAPAARSLPGRLRAWLSRRNRSALRELRETARQPAALSATDAVDLVRSAGQQLDEWRQRRVDGGEPRLPQELDRVRARVRAVASALDGLGTIIRDDGLAERDHGDLSGFLDRLASNLSVVATIPRLRELKSRFHKAGVTTIIERVGREIPPERAADAVEHAWLSGMLDDLAFDDPQLATFDSSVHSRHRDEFITLDRQHRDSTPQRVRRLAAEATVVAMNKHPEQERLVRREAAKKRRHLSVRQLFARAPHVLSALRPCWTMSPVLATEMIPANLDLFDVVIFDEASQIPPAEAIGSLARAPQAVIAGDSRQLPPTSFFGINTADDDADDDGDAIVLADIESLLDAAGTLLRDTMLKWHYRSRDDRLIAFSNAHFYGGGLTAFPGNHAVPPVSLRLIPFRPLDGVSGTRSNPDEVKDVVELVIAHAHERPRETLGVIAFGLHHANNIENALLSRLGEMDDRSLDEFFAETNAERFFVKNIERVQGDERDAIILSVGYHKDANGRLPYRFGPILQEGGERRLNVAVTRARSRLTIVSSFSHHDMEPGRSNAKGVELLRSYLEFAACGGATLGGTVVDVPLNPFERSIAEGLERRGIPFTPQYGVSGYRIDFACAHPHQRGLMVLAIEGDGASYHSSPTARDRDRLRQQVLEDKGWRFHRIWSTAWFRDREAELDKAEAAWRKAVEASEDTPPPAQPAAPPGAALPAEPQRTARPNVPRKGHTPGYDSIADYSDDEIVSLARWIESDGLLRTDDQLMEELRRELGFQRRGKRIEEALTRAVGRARR